MATWFSGTSTGNNYQVGSSYRGSGGDIFTANSDGSFTNERTGRASVGSSQSSDVTWSTNDREPDLPRTLVTDEGRVIETRFVGGGPGVAQDGVGNVATVGPGSPGAGAAGTAGPGNAATGTGVLTPEMKETGTQLVVGGSRLSLDRGWSDAGEAEERWGEGELLSPTWFYQWGVAIADAGANLQRWANAPETQQWAKQVDDAVGGVFAPSGRQWSSPPAIVPDRPWPN